MSDLSRILIHNPECKVREIGEGLAILAPGESAAHSLEDVGVFPTQHRGRFAGQCRALVGDPFHRPTQTLDFVADGRRGGRVGCVGNRGKETRPADGDTR